MSAVVPALAQHRAPDTLRYRPARGLVSQQMAQKATVPARAAS